MLKLIQDKQAAGRREGVRKVPKSVNGCGTCAVTCYLTAPRKIDYPRSIVPGFSSRDFVSTSTPSIQPTCLLSSHCSRWRVRVTEDLESHSLRLHNRLLPQNRNIQERTERANKIHQTHMSTNKLYQSDTARPNNSYRSHATRQRRDHHHLAIGKARNLLVETTTRKMKTTRMRKKRIWKRG